MVAWCSFIEVDTIIAISLEINKGDERKRQPILPTKAEAVNIKGSGNWLSSQQQYVYIEKIFSIECLVQSYFLIVHSAICHCMKNNKTN